MPKRESELLPVTLREHFKPDTLFFLTSSVTLAIFLKAAGELRFSES